MFSFAINQFEVTDFMEGYQLYARANRVYLLLIFEMALGTLQSLNGTNLMKDSF